MFDGFLNKLTELRQQVASLPSHEVGPDEASDFVLLKAPISYSVEREAHSLS